MDFATVSISLISLGLALYALATSRRLASRERGEHRAQPHPEAQQELEQETQRTLKTQRELEHETEQNLIYDLVREVHALRETKIRELEESGEPIRHSVYARLYEETALLTHNSAGPSTGWHKLFVAFRGRAPGSDFPFPGRQSWAELSVLPRLGFDTQGISEYKKRAHEAMHYT